MASDNPKIVATGAMGGLGSDVVEQLLKLAPASDLGVSVHRPEAAEHLAARGVRVRRGDFDAPETPDHAFEDTERFARGLPVAAARSLATEFASRAAGELAVVESTFGEIVG